jgi:hypothetical protein
LLTFLRNLYILLELFSILQLPVTMTKIKAAAKKSTIGIVVANVLGTAVSIKLGYNPLPGICVGIGGIMGISVFLAVHTAESQAK